MTSTKIPGLKTLRQRLARTERRLAELEARPPDPREERLPMDVAHRCRRARRALRSVHVALRPTYAKRLYRAALKLAEAEWEIRCADELIARMAAEGQEGE